MKKLINTRKVIVAAMILTIVLFVFPLSSFSGPGGPKGGVDPIVCSSEGYITDIEFDFGDGFGLKLPIIDEYGDPILDDAGNIIYFEATITKVQIYAPGQELIVVTPKEQFIYNATLTEDVTDPGYVYATTDGEDPLELVFEFKSASIFEQFKIKKKDIPDANNLDAACASLHSVTEPKKVDLFFEVKNARLFLGEDLNGYDLFAPPFNFILVIDKGKPVVSQDFLHPNWVPVPEPEQQ